MRTVIAALLATVLLAACGGQHDDESATRTAEPEERVRTFADDTIGVALAIATIESPSQEEWFAALKKLSSLILRKGYLEKNARCAEDVQRYVLRERRGASVHIILQAN